MPSMRAGWKHIRFFRETMHPLANTSPIWFAWLARTETVVALTISIYAAFSINDPDAQAGGAVFVDGQTANSRRILISCYKRWLVYGFISSSNLFPHYDRGKRVK